MAYPIKKIEKEFLYTDDSVNVYGFRLLTSGYMIDMFKANPIGFYLHAPEEMPRSEGVLVRWGDFRVDGDKVYAKPTINLSHPRGERTVDEVENGFLNAASVGKIVVVEISDDPTQILPGQTGPTVTKWYHKELSLVDIPGNENALTPSPIQLFDVNGAEINLTDFVERTLKNIHTNHDLKYHTMEINKNVLTALNLSDKDSEATAIAKIADLMAKASRSDALLNDKTVLAKELSDLKKETSAKEVTTILSTALAENRITKELSDIYAVDYAENPTALKKVVSAMKPYKSLVDDLNTGNEGKEMKDLADKSWSELDKAGLLEDLKAGNLPLFKQKYKAKFKKDYKE